MTKRKRKTSRGATSSSKKPKRSTNLNHRFPIEQQVIRRTPQEYMDGTSGEIWFDNIEEHLIGRIKDPENCFALIFSPWLSSQPILKCCREHLKGVSCLTNLDKGTKSKIRTEAFSKLPPFQELNRVRVLGAGSGRNRTLPHCKIVLFLDMNQQPREVVTGSSNLSGQIGSLEVMVLLRSCTAGKAFYDEFMRQYELARPYIR